MTELEILRRQVEILSAALTKIAKAAEDYEPLAAWWVLEQAQGALESAKAVQTDHDIDEWLKYRGVKQ